MTALSTTRVGGFCSHGQTGLGWLGGHHCWACGVAVLCACASFDAAVICGELDADGCDVIYARSLGTAGVGLAILDRLTRAAHASEADQPS